MQAHCNLIDIHCHRLNPTGELQILSLDTYQLTGPINGLAAQDRPNPASTQNPTPYHLPCRDYFSLGIHPWFIERQDIDAALQVLKNYRTDSRLLAIGECGLDKCITTPIAKQVAVFQLQIELANQWQKPLIIHCVKAYNELMRLKTPGKTPSPWIIHGFNHHPELAKQLLSHGCYLSLNKALLNPNSKAARVVQTIPPDRLFLETDAATDIQISAIYAAAAKIIGITVYALRQQIFSNFEKVFLQ